MPNGLLDRASAPWLASGMTNTATATASTTTTELTIIVTFPNGQECTRVMTYRLDAVEAMASFQRGRTGPYALASGETYRVDEITTY